MQMEQPAYKAGGTIAPCVFVRPDTTQDFAVVSCTTGDDPCGVSTETMKRMPGLTGSDATVAAESGEPIEVHGLGEVCLLTCGSSVTRGDFLKPDGSGNALTASSGDIAGARALESGAASAKIKVLVLRTKK